ALYVIFVFFFSSRRRHTRFSRDWSSDVCSSDLVGEGIQVRAQVVEGPHHLAVDGAPGAFVRRDLPWPLAEKIRGHDVELARLVRSEERRVGKECRSQRAP